MCHTTPDASVAKLSAGFAARLVPSALLGDSDFGALQLRRPQGLIYRNLDGVELVIPGHLLDQSAAAIVVEHDEVADHGEEAARLKDAFQHHLKFGQVRVGQRLPGDGAPGLEPLPTGSQRADTGLGSVGDHQRLVHGEQEGQLRLVGLELLPGRPDGGVLVRRVLQFDDA